MDDPRSKEAQARLRSLADVANAIKLESRIPIKRYFRSGTEMLRMAEVYSKEGSIENSYTIYLRFLTIFVEKIKEHPEYHTLSPSERSQFNSKLKLEIFPKTESLKQELLKLFQKEHEQYLNEMEKIKQKDKIRMEQEMEALQIQKETEERQKLLNAEKEKLMGETYKQQQSILDPAPTLSIPAYYPTPLYPVDEVPSLKPENKVISSISAGGSLPDFDRNLKPRTVFFNSTGLRTVVIPAALLDEFVTLAHSNTANNIETCGILAGQLAHNQFNVTHLLIPKQKGNSDSCSTQNEEELFAVQDKHNLVTLGWIHTHPTQTAFLSSVDLHTHCSYQLMMPEAVAVVCAPKYNETGYFTLTTNHGLDLIAGCRQQGFHPHPSNPPLFQESLECHVSIMLIKLE